jgi:hypothetical protein
MNCADESGLGPRGSGRQEILEKHGVVYAELRDLWTNPRDRGSGFCRTE